MHGGSYSAPAPTMESAPQITMAVSDTLHPERKNMPPTQNATPTAQKVTAPAPPATSTKPKSSGNMKKFVISILLSILLLIILSAFSGTSLSPLAFIGFTIMFTLITRFLIFGVGYMMQLTKDKKTGHAITMCAVSGIPNIAAGLVVKISLNESDVKIASEVSTHSATLRYDQITNIGLLTEEQVLHYEKQKSVVGRAVVGQLLLGPLGAIVGGMSGIGSTQKSKTSYKEYLIINYTTTSNEESVISLGVVGSTMGLMGFMYNFYIKTGIPNPNLIAQPAPENISL